MESLTFLIFSKNEIFPLIENEIAENEKQSAETHPDRSVDWWHKTLFLQHSFWEPLEKWLYNNYTPDTLKVRTEFGIGAQEGWPPDLLKRAQTRDMDERAKINERLSELTSLGVLDLRVNSATIGGGSGRDFCFTSFGLKFVEFLD